jgi:hypothetical protein
MFSLKNAVKPISFRMIYLEIICLKFCAKFVKRCHSQAEIGCSLCSLRLMLAVLRFAEGLEILSQPG